MATANLTRRAFLELAGLGALAWSMPRRVSRAASHERPNVVVILTDDQACRAIGYNNPVVKTPNLDRLASEGLIFDGAYVASPICAASRASLATGLYPQQHGAISLDATGFRRLVVEERRVKTLAQYLGEAGYTTVFCGKSHLGAPREYGFAVGDEIKDPTDDETFAFAKDYIAGRQADDPPFLLWLAARQPHIPLKPEEQWTGLYDPSTFNVDPNFREHPLPESIYNQGLPGEHYYRDSELTYNFKNAPSGPPRTRQQIIDFLHGYYATISRLDHQVGELVAHLKAAELYDDTVIVFLSDNGYHVGNHGLGNKITMHEESVRLPMFIRWGGLAQTGVRTASLVSTVDLLPTLLELAGVERPQHLPGASIVPILQNPQARLHDYVASECVGVGGKPGEGHRMVRTTRWKYVLTDTNEEALFDVPADPYELANVCKEQENAEVLKTLRGYMRAWMSAIGDTHQPPPE